MKPFFLSYFYSGFFSFKNLKSKNFKIIELTIITLFMNDLSMSFWNRVRILRPDRNFLMKYVIPALCVLRFVKWPSLSGFYVYRLFVKLLIFKIGTCLFIITVFIHTFVFSVFWWAHLFWSVCSVFQLVNSI